MGCVVAVSVLVASCKTSVGEVEDSAGTNGPSQVGTGQVGTGGNVSTGGVATSGPCEGLSLEAIDSYQAPSRTSQRFRRGFVVERWTIESGIHLYAMPALEGPASGMTSQRENPALLHQLAKSAPV